jgi:hypothetical protein
VKTDRRFSEPLWFIERPRRMQYYVYSKKSDNPVRNHRGQYDLAWIHEEVAVYSCFSSDEGSSTFRKRIFRRHCVILRRNEYFVLTKTRLIE